MSDTPPPAQTDDKDWTWVLDRPCPDCGVDVGHLAIADVAQLNRTNATAWANVLARDSAWVTTRPSPDVWSPLEYGCHVRDVFTLFLERLELMLSSDNPMFANWNPNTTAEAERYDLSDPVKVGEEILTAAEQIAARFETVTVEDLLRKGRRSDGAEFTIESFARYEIHDPVHHLWDVTGPKTAID